MGGWHHAEQECRWRVPAERGSIRDRQLSIRKWVEDRKFRGIFPLMEIPAVIPWADVRPL